MNTQSFPLIKPAQVAWRRSIGWVVRAVVRFVRRLWPRRARPDDDHPGLEGAGRPVPRWPKPPHHLVAAQALPPSDKTYLFARD